jgi:hypothetical protein
MSESQATFDLIGKQHAALADKIAKNAWRIAGGMVVGLVTEVDGKRIPMEHLILKELAEEVNKEIHR